MKKFQALIILSAITLAVVGCTKLDSILPKGVWQATAESKVEYLNGVAGAPVLTAADSLPAYTFYSDNTGLVTSPGISSTFAWSVNENGDRILITPDGSSVVLDVEVLEKTRKSQKWFYKITYQNGDYMDVTAFLEQE